MYRVGQQPQSRQLIKIQRTLKNSLLRGENTKELGSSSLIVDRSGILLLLEDE